MKHKYIRKNSRKWKVDEIQVIPMKLKARNDTEKIYTFETKIELTTGGDYGYTFRVMPKHEMLLEKSDLNLIKWITK